jgi:hypothetical protein
MVSKALGSPCPGTLNSHYNKNFWGRLMHENIIDSAEKLAEVLKTRRRELKITQKSFMFFMKTSEVVFFHVMIIWFLHFLMMKGGKRVEVVFL